MCEKTTKSWWLALEGDAGTTYLPREDFPFTQRMLDKMNGFADFPPSLAAHYQGDIVYCVAFVHGYGVRQEGEPWRVFGTLEEAKVAIREAQLVWAKH